MSYLSIYLIGLVFSTVLVGSEVAYSDSEFTFTRFLFALSSWFFVILVIGITLGVLLKKRGKK
jgi:hypothetical protein